MPRKAPLLAALALLSGCSSFRNAYYDFTGKMTPEYAKERGVPECADKTAQQCLKVRKTPAPVASPAPVSEVAPAPAAP